MKTKEDTLPIGKAIELASEILERTCTVKDIEDAIISKVVIVEYT